MREHRPNRSPWFIGKTERRFAKNAKKGNLPAFPEKTDRTKVGRKGLCPNRDKGVSEQENPILLLYFNIYVADCQHQFPVLIFYLFASRYARLYRIRRNPEGRISRHVFISAATHSAFSAGGGAETRAASPYGRNCPLRFVKAPNLTRPHIFAMLHPFFFSHSKNRSGLKRKKGSGRSDFGFLLIFPLLCFFTQKRR